MSDALDWLRQALGDSSTLAVPPGGFRPGGGLNPRQQALIDWLSQASPEALRDLQPSYAEGQVLPPTLGQQRTFDVGAAEQQATRGEPRRDQALDDAIAWRDQGWRGPPGMRTPYGQTLPSAQANENRYVGEPIGDIRPAQGGLLDLSPEEMAAFMRSGNGGYTGDPRFPRGPNVPQPMQAPFGFNVGAQTRPFDWQAGVNAQIGPFELGLSAQKYRPHIGGSLMYRYRIPF